MAEPVRVPLPHGQMALIDADAERAHRLELLPGQSRGLTVCSGGEL